MLPFNFHTTYDFLPLDGSLQTLDETKIYVAVSSLQSSNKQPHLKNML